MAVRRAFFAFLAAPVALAVACSSDPSGSGAPAPAEDASPGPGPGDPDGSTPLIDAAPPIDASVPPSSGGKGGLSCTSTATVAGRSICTAKVGSVELKILAPKAGAGPLRLGVYVHGDGAGAHKSGSVLTALAPWADAQRGLVVSFLAPNGCAWWLAPTHDCASNQTDADVAGANAAALAAAIDAVLKAYDVRSDGVRYYGASGGSIFLTDEWIPLQGGTYPGVFAIMCGGDASTRTYGWDASNAALRARNPLWFTYGDQDFLLTDEKAAVAAFKSKGFAVTEKVLPNKGHCEFDAHGEAASIWTLNP
ncbi:MAG TPA: hypothetical protein VLT33_49555 [Labilithrix sp.]|nr:hypothetical protein [Labilithrix sp.]